jgi:hypothetical protein
MFDVTVENPAGYPVPPDIRYWAFRTAGNPDKSVSCASQVNNVSLPITIKVPALHLVSITFISVAGQQVAADLLST